MITIKTSARLVEFVIAGFVYLIVMSVPVAAPALLQEPVSLLPDSIGGYAPQEEDGVYTYDTLFQLIDGSAEVYRSFNIHLAVSRRYGKPGAPDILVDIFDMGSSRDAFGAYHHDMREGEDVGVGHESEHIGGALYFWKDRFFVSILAFDETAETERAVLALGGEIAGKIPRRGVKPEILRLLPEEGLHADQVSYFHDWTYLNTRHFIADENLLGLGRDTEGVLARYRAADRTPGRADEDTFLILLARYPSAARAGKGLERFLAGYLPEADPHGVGRRDDGTWAAAWLMDDIVVAVLDAANDPDFGRLAIEVREARGH